MLYLKSKCRFPTDQKLLNKLTNPRLFNYTLNKPIAIYEEYIHRSVNICFV